MACQSGFGWALSNLTLVPVALLNRSDSSSSIHSQAIPSASRTTSWHMMMIRFEPFPGKVARARIYLLACSNRSPPRGIQRITDQGSNQSGRINKCIRGQMMAMWTSCLLSSSWLGCPHQDAPNWILDMGPSSEVLHGSTPDTEIFSRQRQFKSPIQNWRVASWIWKKYCVTVYWSNDSSWGAANAKRKPQRRRTINAIHESI